MYCILHHIATMACINWNRTQMKGTLEFQGCEDLQDKKKIKEIHLCFNFISDIPHGVFHGFSQLAYLSVNCNSLAAIPNLDCIPALKELHLANNQIAVVKNLEGLQELECLSLRCNRIQCLEGILGNGKLKRLSLSGNSISRINWDGIPSLCDLTFLGIYSNQLINLEDILKLLSKTPKLTAAYLGCNPFSNGRPLTLSSVLLDSRHIEQEQVTELYSRLKNALGTTAMQPNPGLDVTLRTVCGMYTQSSVNVQRLLRVAQILADMRKVCVSLVSVDGEEMF